MRLTKAIEKQEQEINELAIMVEYELRLGDIDMAVFYQRRKELLEKQIALAKVL